MTEEIKLHIEETRKQLSEVSKYKVQKKKHKQKRINKKWLKRYGYRAAQ